VPLPGGGWLQCHGLFDELLILLLTLKANASVHRWERFQARWVSESHPCSLSTAFLSCCRCRRCGAAAARRSQNTPKHTRSVDCGECSNDSSTPPSYPYSTSALLVRAAFASRAHSDLTEPRLTFKRDCKTLWLWQMVPAIVFCVCGGSVLCLGRRGGKQTVLPTAALWLLSLPYETKRRSVRLYCGKEHECVQHNYDTSPLQTRAHHTHSQSTAVSSSATPGLQAIATTYHRPSMSGYTGTQLLTLQVRKAAAPPSLPAAAAWCAAAAAAGARPPPDAPK